MMRVLDLFSGIGGFSLGLERAGMETVAFCEIEEYPRQVLRKHWPDVPIFEDVRKLKGEDVGPVDLICGGYPCQPFSLAGERRGQDDDRHLWPEMFRLLHETGARWLIGENVAGHISMGLDEVLSDLEGAGYTTQTFVIPACGLDAPHRRDRLWIVAHAECTERRQGEPCGNVTDRQNAKWQETAGWTGTPAENGRGRIMANANDTRSQERQVFAGGESEARPAPEGQTIERNSRWPVEPAVGRVANGIPRRVDRLKCLGNAVVPQIPEVIGRAIMAAEGF